MMKIYSFSFHLRYAIQYFQFASNQLKWISRITICSFIGFDNAIKHRKKVKYKWTLNAENKNDGK